MWKYWKWDGNDNKSLDLDLKREVTWNFHLFSGPTFLRLRPDGRKDKVQGKEAKSRLRTRGKDEEVSAAVKENLCQYKRSRNIIISRLCIIVACNK